MKRLLTINGLSEETGVDRRTVAKRLKSCGFKPAERRGEFDYYDYEEVFPYVMGDTDDNENFLLLTAHLVVTVSHGEAFEHVARTLDAKLKEAGLSPDQTDAIIAAAAVASIEGWRDVARQGYLRHMARDPDQLARDVLRPHVAPKQPCYRFRYPRLFNMPGWVVATVKKAGLSTDLMLPLGGDDDE